MNQVWLASVFHGPGALGNPTGVVLRSAPVPADTAQRLAAQLGCVDTAFIWPGPRGYVARFYSPAESLAVCYQGVIGAARALGGERVTLELEDRSLVVEQDDELGWVKTPSELVHRGDAIATPAGQGRIIDAGRRRAYVALDEAGLVGFAWRPEDALLWLGERSLSGLCLVHQRADGDVSLRVFTTSLDGREDGATGGAVAGLPMFLERHAPCRIHQGIGSERHRGCLHLRSDEAAVWVGGATRLLVRGVPLF